MLHSLLGIGPCSMPLRNLRLLPLMSGRDGLGIILCIVERKEEHVETTETRGTGEKKKPKKTSHRLFVRRTDKISLYTVASQSARRSGTRSADSSAAARPQHQPSRHKPPPTHTPTPATPWAPMPCTARAARTRPRAPVPRTSRASPTA